MEDLNIYTSGEEGSSQEDSIPHRTINKSFIANQARYPTNIDEILITEDGRVADPSARDPQAAKESLSPQMSQRSHVFETPYALENFLATQSHDSIKIIRAKLLFSLESSVLTASEQAGSYGPNVSPLLAAWRKAFTSIPPTVSLVQLDVSHTFSMRTHTLGKLVQHISTTVFLRSKKEARCEILGTKTVQGKAFLEDSMVGLREGSAESKGSVRYQIGDE